MKINNYKPINVHEWQNADYFMNRNLNDIKRLKQFALDKEFIQQFVKDGTVCDVGCSTGEFLRYIDWVGPKYGMEVNLNAIEIASNFISFEKNIFNTEDFFDLIIFRGTIQHVDEPFRMIKSSFNALKKGGYLIFLSTPNADSILYKAKRDLAMLDWKLNFYIPGEKEMRNALENYGYIVDAIEFPYLKTPYSSLIKDHLYFLVNVFTPWFIKHPFWKSSMNIAARKP